MDISHQAQISMVRGRAVNRQRLSGGEEGFEPRELI